MLLEVPDSTGPLVFSLARSALAELALHRETQIGILVEPKYPGTSAGLSPL